MGELGDNRGVHTLADLIDCSPWSELTGFALDLAGQLVSVSADAIIVERVRVQRTELSVHYGRRWATVHLGENVRLLFCEQGLLEVGWESQDEREWLAVRDRGGERELMILLERE